MWKTRQMRHWTMKRRPTLKRSSSLTPGRSKIGIHKKGARETTGRTTTATTTGSSSNSNYNSNKKQQQQQRRKKKKQSYSLLQELFCQRVDEEDLVIRKRDGGPVFEEFQKLVSLVSMNRLENDGHK